ncbi:rhodanese-like domain-containing protein [Parendozoicomonas sp. Alg238-R29]|uniref:rhodanese-like domain-containing protein n=1 Tax=Parendozoicomonas sp. Alg238-R29 TaxID=2993446 RepID=UPI00248E69EE|nr:rhodanese-like domain-containing protein [Parendozoicomonas sp. Alg238-R29]
MYNKKQAQLFLPALLTVFLGGCWLKPAPNELPPTEREINDLIVRSYQLAESGGYRLITTGSLKGLMDSDRNPLIMDTLPLSRYQKHHIPGARHFWFPRTPAPTEQWNIEIMEGQTQEDFQSMLGQDLERPLVFYCGRTICDRSHSAAAWAIKLGYKEVYRYAGGINAWLDKPWDGKQPTQACKAPVTTVQSKY